MGCDDCGSSQSLSGWDGGLGAIDYGPIIERGIEVIGNIFGDDDDDDDDDNDREREQLELARQRLLMEEEARRRAAASQGGGVSPIVIGLGVLVALKVFKVF